MSSETLMEKPTNGKCRCRKQSWYIVLISFLLWFTLYMIYLYSSSVTFNKRGYSFIANNNHTGPLDSSDSFHVHDVVRHDKHVKEDINNVEDETETEEKQPVEMTEDEEVNQVIHSMLSEDENETEPVETETNADDNHPTERKEGSAQRENNGEDRVKRKEDQAAKQKGTANVEDREKRKEDRAVQRKGTSNVLIRQRAENLDDREKRKDARVVPRKGVANFEGQEKVKEDHATKRKETANVSRRQREENAGDQGRVKKDHAANRKETRKEGNAEALPVETLPIVKSRIEDEEVIQVIDSMLSEDQNETEPVETETNADDNHPTERKEGSAQMGNSGEDRVKRKEDQAAKQKGTVNVEDQEKRKEDRAVQRKGTANVSRRQRVENLDDKEKRKDARVVPRKGAVNVEGQEKVEEDRATKRKETADVSRRQRAENLDQEKRKDARVVPRKGAANAEGQEKVKEDRATKRKETANVSRRQRAEILDQEKRKDDRVVPRKRAANVEGQEQVEEDRVTKRKEIANVSRRQRAENLDQEKRKDDRVVPRKGAANVEGQEKVEEDRATKRKETANVSRRQREKSAEDQGRVKKDHAANQKETANVLRRQRAENLDQDKRKDDRVVPRKGAENVEGQGKVKEDRATKRKETANVSRRQREKNAEDQGRVREDHAANRKETANVAERRKEGDAEALPVETLPIVKSRTERNRHPRTRGGNKPTNSSDPVVEKRTEKAVTEPRRQNLVRAGTDSCSGRYIYIHNLPKKFNQDLLENCRSLSFWTDMCECASNLGLGAPLPTDGKLYSMTGWFNTNQFLLEVIFHNRMKQYKCLTKDPSVASAIFVPYYAGLDVGRYLWDPDGFMRDYDAVNLVKWLASRPEWKRMWGRDHFLVAGRINWDFRRDPRNESDWGNELLNFDESRNMTTLVLESSPWNYNDFAIPYPTYFHPSRDYDVVQWQNKMRKLKRRVLFSFAGARRPDRHESIRNELIDQCLASRRRCRFLECDKTQKCHKPANLMKLFQSSIFCLQPPGDSYTRRSIFDSIIAGCIPVFFHPGSGYVQYIWHFPKDYSNYSVLIHERDVKFGKANIERILQKVSRERRVAMRDEIISMIPKVIYADPSSRLEKIEDAFDLTVKGVLDRVETVRNQMKEGKIVNYEFDEEESWKYFAFGKLEPHEWDTYFSRKIGQRGP